MTGRPRLTLTPLVEGQQLHGNVALVVIHGHHDVELALRGAQENGVGRQRAADVQPARAGRRPRPAESRAASWLPNRPSSLACGFSPATRDARRGDAQRQAGGWARSITSSTRARVTRRMASSSETCVQTCTTRSAVADQQHADLLRAGALGQQFGMPGIVKPGQVHGFFIERGGHHAVDLAGQGQVAGGEDIFHRRPARGGADLARPGRRPGRRWPGRAGSGCRAGRARRPACATVSNAGGTGAASSQAAGAAARCARRRRPAAGRSGRPPAWRRALRMISGPDPRRVREPQGSAHQGG